MRSFAPYILAVKYIFDPSTDIFVSDRVHLAYVPEHQAFAYSYYTFISPVLRLEGLCFICSILLHICINSQSLRGFSRMAF